MYLRPDLPESAGYLLPIIVFFTLLVTVEWVYKKIFPKFKNNSLEVGVTALVLTAAYVLGILYFFQEGSALVIQIVIWFPLLVIALIFYFLKSMSSN